ncbi:3-oxoadipate enol-lactonase/3-oxoadipate enol-lactonase/4-carboxymuconolactone decarboxylase [Novosphingobium capsulatum]|uniref:3-oxoadipate enol-lactonase/3-oxoadipate enol-lactonase/4-carboxymuconolactone decarboxylase n=1 Tax=Novosphingobium capsulatum TaxID=13688 RepID=A0ABU1MNG2_9SPHN|nr:alpha/beta fold hydrolase [Novosphingobium capsulatum]MDR6511891.1 3-oxoadipate enol-lactonase/3-oxoadipate enol-lactonase/4-carboxymuconolactone decarboxylase [Novosphingobium capsulatum]
MTLAIHIDGPAGAPPLVFLHAIATSAALWRPQVDQLSQRFRVVRVDLPGHGASALLPEGAGFADYADAVAETLSTHGIDRFSLVGMSFGAMVAMRVALRHATRVERLVLACCAARTPPPVAAMWHERIAMVEREGIETQVETSLDRWFTPDFAAASPQTLDWVRGMIRQTPAAGFVAAARIIATLDHMALLPKLAMPCLVLAGAEDKAAAPAMMQDFAAHIPTARFATLPAAHLANVEAPGAFGETIARFVEGQ